MISKQNADTNFRVLIIPDIHEHVQFVMNILEKEDLDQIDKIVFLGDYFDYRGPKDPNKSPGAIANLITDLVKDGPLAKKITLLIGNHDLPYIGMHYLEQNRDKISSKAYNDFYECWSNYISGYHDSRLIAIEKHWNGPGIWEKLEAFSYVNGHLLSHAGLHPNLFIPQPQNIDDVVLMIKRHWDINISMIKNCDPDIFTIPKPLLSVGAIRNGSARCGGIFWMDLREVEEDSPYPQIRGHDPMQRAFLKHNYYSIDVKQSHYAVLGDKVEIRSAY